MPDSVSMNILCESEVNDQDQYIKIPRDVQQMGALKINFNTDVQKYKNLYEDWTKLAEMVIDEIEGRIPSPEPEGPEKKVVHFPYLIDKRPRDLGIQINAEKVPGSEDGRELINCGDKKLFFNLTA